MYRALFTADVHCSNSLPYTQRDPESLIGDRLQDTLSVLRQMSAYALEHDIDDIWILGDLIDKRLVDAVTLKLVAEQLKLMSKQHTLRLSPGNHEAHDGKARHFVLDAFRELDIWVADANQPELLRPNGEIRVWAIPYQPHLRARELIEAIDGKQDTLLLLHQTIRGGKVGSWVCPEGLEPELLSEFPAVLSGHFHTPQSITDSIVYLGAPLQHNFGDAPDTRGFWDVVIGEDLKLHPDTKMIEPEVPQFHELIWPDVQGDKIQQAEQYRGAYIKMKVTGSEAEVKRRMRDANEVCKFMLENGARYANPIPAPTAEPAKRRMSGLDGNNRQSWPQVLSGYLDVCEVTGENRAKLEALGTELITEAEA